MAVKTASGLGVTSPLNNASIAIGKDGVGVPVGVFETAGVMVGVDVGVIVGVDVMVGVGVIVGINVGVGDGGKYV